MSRVIQFEGRTIQVPDDATDADVAGILSAPPAPDLSGVAAAAQTDLVQQPGALDAKNAADLAALAPAAEPSLVDRLKSAVFGDKVAPGGVTSLVTGQPAADPNARGVMGTVDQGVRGLAQGAATMAALPVDLAAAEKAVRGYVGEKTGLTGSFADSLISTNPFLSAPGRVVDALASAQPYVGADALHGYMDSANRATADTLGVTRPVEKGQNVFERGANRVGQEVGAAAIPVAGAVGYGAKIGVDAARKLPFLARMFVEPAAVDAGKFAAKEGATAVAAGSGAAVANELTRAAGVDEKSGWHAGMDFLGALTGALGLGAARAVGKPLKDVGQAVFNRDKFSNDVVKNAAVDRIVNNADTLPKVEGQPVDTAPLVNAIVGGRRTDATIPGFKESTADRTGDPGLAALEYGRQSGQGAGQFTARRAENTAAVDSAMNRNAPDGNPADLRAELDLERARRLTDADTTARNASDAATTAVADVTPRYTPQARGSTVRSAVDDALQRFIADTQTASTAATRSADDLVGRIAPQSDPAVRGNVVRSALEDSRDQARARTETAYDSANIGGRQADPVELRQGLDAVNDGLTATERGLVPQAAIDRVRALGRVDEAVPGQPAPAPPDPIRLKEATDLRSELLRLQRAALADPRAEKGGRNAARVLGQYVDSVENFIRGSLTPEELDALGAARAAKTAEADAFTRAGDPVATVLARQEGGNPRVRDERVAGAFVSPATDAPLQRLFTEADTPAVRGAIRDEIVSKLPDSARRNPDALDRFMADYEIPLRQFPGLRNEIAAASAARRGAAEAETAVTTRRQEFSGDSRALADVSARRSDGTPVMLDEQIPGPFANPAGNRDLDALLARADTPAVRTAIEDEMLGRAASSTDRPERIQAFIADHAEPLKRFPGLQERLVAAAKARGAERETAASADALTRELGTPDRPGTSTVGKYLAYDDTRSQDAMKGIIASKKPGAAMDEALNFVNNDPKAVEGARKSFWDLMQSKARSNGETTRTTDGAQPWMPNRLKNFLDDPAHQAVAERLYRDNPEQLGNVRKIAEELQNVDLRARSKAPNTSGTAQGVSNVLTPETLQSRFLAYKRGQISAGFLITAIGSVMARRLVRGAQGEAIEKLVDKALLDPDLAAQLLKENNPANRAALARTAKAYLGNEASTLTDILDGEPADPVKGAIMKKDDNGR